MENLTTEMQNRANEYIRQIDDMGGMISAIERGYPQSEIANASYRYQTEIETGERKIVGVNAFHAELEARIELLQIDDSAASLLRDRLAKVKAERDGLRVAGAIEALRRCAEGSGNTMPYILDAVRTYATVGEICDVFRGVFHVFDRWGRNVSMANS